MRACMCAYAVMCDDMVIDELLKQNYRITETVNKYH